MARACSACLPYGGLPSPLQPAHGSARVTTGCVSDQQRQGKPARYGTAQTLLALVSGNYTDRPDSQSALKSGWSQVKIGKVLFEQEGLHTLLQSRKSVAETGDAD